MIGIKKRSFKIIAKFLFIAGKYTHCSVVCREQTNYRCSACFALFCISSQYRHVIEQNSGSVIKMVALISMLSPDE